MAFQMNYTNFKGANYPQSYWRFSWYQLDRNAQQARVRFDCFFDESARSSNVENNVLESHNYLIGGEDFVAVFETADDVREAIYDFAKNYKEGPAPQEGEPDTRVSFFATAIDV